jgi:uncharacterized protein
VITKIVKSLNKISTNEWNNLKNENIPFIKHEFLSGLEKYKCLEHQGWYPCHILVEENKRIEGALPLYIKTNSIGEFVFDWSWAEAYQRTGRSYYPKLVSAVPFTPVTGPRFLIRRDCQNADAIRNQLHMAARQYAEQSGISGIHYLFPDESDRRQLRQQGLLLRCACQYHWYNNNYENFDHFLDGLNAKKRKQIKRERNKILDSGIDIEVLKGADITPDHWRNYYEFYVSTFYRKWGAPRFTLDFFQSLSRLMPDETLLIMAKHENEYIAGAFAMCGGDTLYGRHWGCSSRYRFLHFEICYYQTIDYCIRHGLKKLDAGVQGEHKISRGFVPVTTWSAHWIADDQFRPAIEQFLYQEKNYVKQYMHELSKHLAYKSV